MTDRCLATSIFLLIFLGLSLASSCAALHHSASELAELNPSVGQNELDSSRSELGASERQEAVRLPEEPAELDRDMAVEEDESHLFTWIMGALLTLGFIMLFLLTLQDVRRREREHLDGELSSPEAFFEIPDQDPDEPPGAYFLSIAMRYGAVDAYDRDGWRGYWKVIGIGLVAYLAIAAIGLFFRYGLVWLFVDVLGF